MAGLPTVRPVAIIPGEAVETENLSVLFPVDGESAGYPDLRDAPATRCGVSVIVDPADKLDELNETNNEFIWVVQLRPRSP
jgi:hypothetical protein